jgi:uncharacterized protein YjbI with pentapeptide repeats
MISGGNLTKGTVTGGQIQGDKVTGANITDAEANMVVITGANLTGAKLKTGSEASTEGEGPLAKIPIIGETLEKMNPLK